jgi:CubicO group peptidase (beta-lactamase class C family)
MQMRPELRAAALLAVLASLAALCHAQKPAERMQQIVQSYDDAGVFMGSVLVAKHGKVIFSKSYGMADMEWEIPNSPTTRFNIASMTKQFTAASIFLLEDRGKLKTDDPVKKYLPDAPSSWDKITIYNLLTHTSGIADDFADDDVGPPHKLTFHDKALEFQPGEQWSYSNLGYLVLGYVIEKVSGQTYADFVEQNIFKPLGMNDSGISTFATIIPHRATGYWPGANGIENAERPNLKVGYSAGSIYSTTGDLLRWEEGLFGGKLLSPASFHKMTTAFRNDYACGLFSRRINGYLRIEHNGDNIGFNSDMAYYPEEGITVIVLANLNGYVTEKITEDLGAVAHGEPAGLFAGPREITLPKDALAQFAGTWQFEGYSIEFVPEGNHLVAHFDDGSTPMPIFPASENKFFFKAQLHIYEFSKNDKGEYAFVTHHSMGEDQKGVRK